MTLSTLTLGEAIDTIDSAFNNVVADIALNDSTVEEITYAVNNALWVRDYLIGLPENNGISNCIKFINYLSSKVPAQDRFAYDTVNAMFQYELGNVETSMSLIQLAEEVNPNYSLTGLIKRVLSAGWPQNNFAVMRSELATSVEQEIRNNASVVISEMGAI